MSETTNHHPTNRRTKPVNRYSENEPTEGQATIENTHPTEDCTMLARMCKEAAGVYEAKSNNAAKADAIAREAMAGAEMAGRILRAADAALDAYQRTWNGESANAAAKAEPPSMWRDR